MAMAHADASETQINDDTKLVIADDTDKNSNNCKSMMPLTVVFQVTSIIMMTAGVVAFLLPRMSNLLFYDGNMDKEFGQYEHKHHGIEASPGHLIVRIYGALLLANGWLMLHMKEGFYDEATSTYHSPSGRVQTWVVRSFAICFLLSLAEMTRAHLLNDGTMHFFPFTGAPFYLTYAGLALVFLVCFSYNIVCGGVEEQESEDHSSFGLRCLFLAYGTLSAFGALAGLVWPKGYGIFFFDGDGISEGLNHEAAHICVRLLASLLLAQALLCFFVAFPCRRRDHLTMLTTAFTYSGAAVVFPLIDAHQRNDGTMYGVWGLVLVVVLLAFTGAFFFSLKSVSKVAALAREPVKYNQFQSTDEAVHSEEDEEMEAL